jgi:hypothetical protein
MNRMESHERCVKEGRALDESVAFARYVLFSGLCSLCDENPQPSPLKVDGAMLRWKAEDLQRLVTERYRLRDTSAHMQKSELETMHDKLDKIAGYLSHLTQAPAVAVNPIGALRNDDTDSTMRFQVIPGGLAESNPAQVQTLVNEFECDPEGKKRDNLPDVTHGNVA